MSDFFDQETGYDDEGMDVPMNDRPNGATCLVNGSYRDLEVGAPFLQTVQSLALQAGFGKFKVMLNGTEVRPRTAPSVIEGDMKLELRPFDEAG